METVKIKFIESDTLIALFKGENPVGIVLTVNAALNKLREKSWLCALMQENADGQLCYATISKNSALYGTWLYWPVDGTNSVKQMIHHYKNELYDYFKENQL